MKAGLKKNIAEEIPTQSSAIPYGYQECIEQDSGSRNERRDHACGPYKNHDNCQVHSSPIIPGLNLNLI